MNMKLKKAVGPLSAVILLALAAFAYYLWQQGPTNQPSQQPTVSAPADAPAPQAEATEPAIQHPVPETAETPLPALDRSDPTALAALADVFGAKSVKQFFAPQEIIRRIVVTVDNLPRKVIPAQLRPTIPPDGRFQTAGKGEKLTMAKSNFERYDPFIRVAEMVDAKTFAAAYTSLYPLFQQAYRDLGYPTGYFNDRLVAVIDHMLEAPQTDEPIALVQPHIFYKFADPELEALSAGHKLMLRIGNENAEKMKKKLREIRRELATSGPKQQ